MEEKSRLTIRFLRAKMDEYENLKMEIEQIRREADARGAER